MARTVLLRPDTELIISTWLAAELAADGVTVVTHLEHGWEENDLPLVQLARAGGRPSNTLLDQPRLDIECYVDADKHTIRGASELARTVEAVLPAIAGVTVTDPDTGDPIPGVITEVAVESGPSWRPDFNSKVWHYGLTVLAMVRYSEGPPRGARARYRAAMANAAT